MVKVRLPCVRHVSPKCIYLIGILAQSSLDIRARLSKRFDTSQEDEEESDIEYPLTPPSSDDSESRPISPYSDDADHNLKVITIPIPSIPIKVQRKLQNLKAGVRHRRTERKLIYSSSLIAHSKPQDAQGENPAHTS